VLRARVEPRAGEGSSRLAISIGTASWRSNRVGNTTAGFYGRTGFVIRS